MVKVSLDDVILCDIPLEKIDKFKHRTKSFLIEDDVKFFLSKKRITENIFANGGLLFIVDKLTINNEESFDNLKFFINGNSPIIKLQDNLDGNIYNVGLSYGFSKNFISNILNLKLVDKFGNNIGSGEILFSLIFNDVYKDINGGDLIYDNKRLEVKCRGGRFGERPDSSLKFSPDYFVKDILSPELLSSYNVTHNNNLSIADHIYNGYIVVGDNFNVYYANVVSKLNSIYCPELLIAEQYLKPVHFCFGVDVIKKCLTKLYIQSNLYKNSVDNVLFIDDKGNYTVISTDNICNYIDKDIITAKKISFKDLYPQVTLNKCNEKELQTVFQF